MTKEEEFIKINNIMTFIKKQDNTMFKIKAKKIQGNNNSNNIIIMKIQLDNNNNNSNNVNVITISIRYPYFFSNRLVFLDIIFAVDWQIRTETWRLLAEFGIFGKRIRYKTK